MIVSIIPPNKIANHLYRIKELLSKIDDLLHPLGTHSDLIADCIAGTALLWGVFDQDKIEEGEEPLVAVLVTYRRDYWRASVLELVGLAGEPGTIWSWLSLLNKVTDTYATATGCISRQIPGGRKEWLRILARYGFTRSDLVTLEASVAKKGR
jgi:hypothetical protein